MKRIYALASLLVAGAVSMFPAKAQNPGWDISADKPAEVKIISYNIRMNSADDKDELSWDQRKDGSVNMILAEMPDVIGFQEPWADQIEYLVENLPQYGHYELGRETGVRADGGEHLLVMWNKEKYHLLGSGNFWLSETPYVMSQGWDGACPRIALWLHLCDKATGRDFYYFDTHLDHRGDVARKEGSKLIVEKMKEIAGEDAVTFLTGDMNVAEGTDREKELLGAFKWLESARQNAPETDRRQTFNGWGTAQAPNIIDYIFYRNAEPLRYETLDGEGYGHKYISDHFPITATFKF